MLTHNRVDFELLHAEALETQRPHASILVANRRASDFELARRILTLLNRFAVDKVPCSSSSCAQDRRAMGATQNFAPLANLLSPFL